MNLLGTRDIRQLCGELGIRPSKKRGQNFVTDPGTVRRIAALGVVEGEESPTVLEIGPGLGSLTLALLERGAKVAAVEIDRLLAQSLPETVRAHGGNVESLRVIQQDALQTTSGAQLVEGTGWEEPRLLVANLPYNVATPLLLHALEVMPKLRRAVVMVQAEVADRWVAKATDEAYGAPSAKLAWWGRAQRAFAVSRQVFIPVPNVDSTVVEFEREDILDRLIQNGLSGLEDASKGQVERLRQETFDVITQAFGQRRKTLRQALALYAGSPNEAASLVEKAGLDPSLRAERLEVVDFAKIAGVKMNRDGEWQ